MQYFEKTKFGSALSKSTALLISFVFSFTSTAQAAPLPFDFRLSAGTYDAGSFSVPETLGTVRDAYFAPHHDDRSPFIIHVQDAHGQYDAQKYIKQLLAYLHKEKGIRLALVEGASTPLSPELFEIFPDENLNKQVAENLSRRAEFSGVELFLLDRPGNFHAVGIEDAGLYRENLRAFRKIYERRPEAEAYLNAAEESLSHIIRQLPNRRLRAFLQAFRTWERDRTAESNHRTTLMDFLKRASREAGDLLGTDLTDPKFQRQWPHIERLLMIEKLEKQLDDREAEKEHGEILRKLGDRNVPADIIESFERMRVSGENASPRRTLERTYDALSDEDFSYLDYPHFRIVSALKTFQDELDPESLFAETLRLSDRIFVALAGSAAERDLVRLSSELELLGDLLRLELTRDGYAIYNMRKDTLAPEAVRRRMEKLRQSAGDRFAHPVTVRPAGEEGMPAGRDGATANLMAEIEAFYETAIRRESVFIEKSLEAMKSLKEKRAVLLTGGFHSEGILRQLREKNISYAVISPRMDHTEKRGGYLTAVTGRAETMFDRAVGDYRSGGTPAASGANALAVAAKSVPFDRWQETLERLGSIPNDAMKVVLDSAVGTVNASNDFGPDVFRHVRPHSILAGVVHWRDSMLDVQIGAFPFSLDVTNGRTGQPQLALGKNSTVTSSGFGTEDEKKTASSRRRRIAPTKKARRATHPRWPFLTDQVLESPSVDLVRKYENDKKMWIKMAETLSTLHTDILRRRFLDKQSGEAIAAALGVSGHIVRSRLLESLVWLWDYHAGRNSHVLDLMQIFNLYKTKLDEIVENRKIGHLLRHKFRAKALTYVEAARVGIDTTLAKMLLWEGELRLRDYHERKLAREKAEREAAHARLEPFPPVIPKGTALRFKHENAADEVFTLAVDLPFPFLNDSVPAISAAGETEWLEIATRAHHVIHVPHPNAEIDTEISLFEYAKHVRPEDAAGFGSSKQPSADPGSPHVQVKEAHTTGGTASLKVMTIDRINSKLLKPSLWLLGFALGLQLTFSFLTGKWHFTVILFSLVFAISVSFAIHEMGHWFAGRSMGFKGRFVWVKGMGPAVEHADEWIDTSTFTDTVITLAGPAANVLAAAASFILGRYLASDHLFAQLLLQLLLVSNVLVGLPQFLPFSFSDGRQSLELWRDKHRTLIIPFKLTENAETLINNLLSHPAFSGIRRFELWNRRIGKPRGLLVNTNTGKLLFETDTTDPDIFIPVLKRQVEAFIANRPAGFGAKRENPDHRDRLLVLEEKFRAVRDRIESSELTSGDRVLDVALYDYKSEFLDIVDIVIGNLAAVLEDRRQTFSEAYAEIERNMAQMRWLLDSRRDVFITALTAEQDNEQLHTWIQAVMEALPNFQEILALLYPDGGPLNTFDRVGFWMAMADAAPDGEETWLEIMHDRVAQTVFGKAPKHTPVVVARDYTVFVDKEALEEHRDGLISGFRALEGALIKSSGRPLALVESSEPLTGLKHFYLDDEQLLRVLAAGVALKLFELRWDTHAETFTYPTIHNVDERMLHPHLGFGAEEQIAALHELIKGGRYYEANLKLTNLLWPAAEDSYDRALAGQAAVPLIHWLREHRPARVLWKAGFLEWMKRHERTDLTPHLLDLFSFVLAESVDGPVRLPGEMPEAAAPERLPSEPSQILRRTKRLRTLGEAEGQGFGTSGAREPEASGPDSSPVVRVDVSMSQARINEIILELAERLGEGETALLSIRSGVSEMPPIGREAALGVARRSLESAVRRVALTMTEITENKFLLRRPLSVQQYEMPNARKGAVITLPYREDEPRPGIKIDARPILIADREGTGAVTARYTSNTGNRFILTTDALDNKIHAVRVKGRGPLIQHLRTTRNGGRKSGFEVRPRRDKSINKTFLNGLSAEYVGRVSRQGKLTRDVITMNLSRDPDEEGVWVSTDRRPPTRVMTLPPSIRRIRQLELVSVGRLRGALHETVGMLRLLGKHPELVFYWLGYDEENRVFTVHSAHDFRMRKITPSPDDPYMNFVGTETMDYFALSPEDELTVLGDDGAHTAAEMFRKIPNSLTLLEKTIGKNLYLYFDHVFDATTQKPVSTDDIVKLIKNVVLEARRRQLDLPREMNVLFEHSFTREKGMISIHDYVSQSADLPQFGPPIFDVIQEENVLFADRVRHLVAVRNLSSQDIRKSGFGTRGRSKKELVRNESQIHSDVSQSDTGVALKDATPMRLNRLARARWLNTDEMTYVREVLDRQHWPVAGAHEAIAQFSKLRNFVVAGIDEDASDRAVYAADENNRLRRIGLLSQMTREEKARLGFHVVRTRLNASTSTFIYGQHFGGLGMRAKNVRADGKTKNVFDPQFVHAPINLLSFGQVPVRIEVLDKSDLGRVIKRNDLHLIYGLDEEGGWLLEKSYSKIQEKVISNLDRHAIIMTLGRRLGDLRLGNRTLFTVENAVREHIKYLPKGSERDELANLLADQSRFRKTFFGAPVIAYVHKGVIIRIDIHRNDNIDAKPVSVTLSLGFAWRPEFKLSYSFTGFLPPDQFRDYEPYLVVKRFDTIGLIQYGGLRRVLKRTAKYAGLTSLTLLNGFVPVRAAILNNRRPGNPGRDDKRASFYRERPFPFSLVFMVHSGETLQVERSFDKILRSEQLKKMDDHVILTNLSKAGSLNMANRVWGTFQDYPFAPVLVRVRNGVPVRVQIFDKKGTKRLRDVRFSLIFKGAFEDEPVLEDAYFNETKRLKELNRHTVSTKLSPGGTLSLGGKVWARFEEFSSKRVILDIIGGVPVHARILDDQGRVIHSASFSLIYKSMKNGTYRIVDAYHVRSMHGRKSVQEWFSALRKRDGTFIEVPKFSGQRLIIVTQLDSGGNAHFAGRQWKRFGHHYAQRFVMANIDQNDRVSLTLVGERNRPSELHGRKTFPAALTVDQVNRLLQRAGDDSHANLFVTAKVFLKTQIQSALAKRDSPSTKGEVMVRIPRGDFNRSIMELLNGLVLDIPELDRILASEWLPAQFQRFGRLNIHNLDFDVEFGDDGVIVRFAGFGAEAGRFDGEQNKAGSRKEWEGALREIFEKVFQAIENSPPVPQLSSPPPDVEEWDDRLASLKRDLRQAVEQIVQTQIQLASEDANLPLARAYARIYDNLTNEGRRMSQMTEAFLGTTEDLAVARSAVEIINEADLERLFDWTLSVTRLFPMAPEILALRYAKDEKPDELEVLYFWHLIKSTFEIRNKELADYYLASPFRPGPEETEFQTGLGLIKVDKDKAEMHRKDILDGIRKLEKAYLMAGGRALGGNVPSRDLLGLKGFFLNYEQLTGVLVVGHVLELWKLGYMVSLFGPVSPPKDKLLKFFDLNEEVLYESSGFGTAQGTGLLDLLAHFDRGAVRNRSPGDRDARVSAAAVEDVLRVAFEIADEDQVRLDPDFEDRFTVPPVRWSEHDIIERARAAAGLDRDNAERVLREASGRIEAVREGAANTTPEIFVVGFDAVSDRASVEALGRLLPKGSVIAVLMDGHTSEEFSNAFDPVSLPGISVDRVDGAIDADLIRRTFRKHASAFVDYEKKLLLPKTHAQLLRNDLQVGRLMAYEVDLSLLAFRSDAVRIAAGLRNPGDTLKALVGELPLTFEAFGQGYHAFLTPYFTRLTELLFEAEAAAQFSQAA